MPTPSRRRRALKWAAGLVVVAAVIAGAVLFVRSIYFLGTDEGGNVAVYRGLPYELPFGVSLYSKQSAIPVQVGTLSEERQRAVTDHELRSEGDADDFLDDVNQREGAAQRAAAAEAARQAAAQAQARKQKQAAARKQKRAQQR